MLFFPAASSEEINAFNRKKRLIYLLVACPIAAFICSIDLSGYLGYHFAPVSGLVLSALLYFTLLIVAYPHLSELHHFSRGPS